MTAAPSSPPNEARQVRVFISSTFRDMHAERDHLVTVVFPELRERVERLGLEFFDVDLRFRLRQDYGGQGGVPAKDSTHSNGQVCFLKLHHGHRCITLAEAEAILVEEAALQTQDGKTQDGKTQDARLEESLQQPQAHDFKDPSSDQSSIL